jgi:methionine synthase II (cobalamin-independent)
MVQITEPLTFFEPEPWIIEAINCALASMHRVVAKKKLQALVRGTEIIRGELSGTH